MESLAWRDLTNSLPQLGHYGQHLYEAFRFRRGRSRWEGLVDSTKGLSRTRVLLLPRLHEAHDSTCLGSLPLVSQSFEPLLGFVILSWFRITYSSHCSI
jgi:hypothetical protein